MNPVAILLCSTGLTLAGRSRPVVARRRLAVAAPARGAAPSPTGVSTGVPAGEQSSGNAVARGLPLAAAVGLVLIGGLSFGLAGGLLALAAAPFAVVAVRRLAARADPAADRRIRPAVPLLLDLIAAALRAGAPTPMAIAAVAAVAPSALGIQFSRTAALLQLGAQPAEAWAPMLGHEVLGPVAAVATRSADSGIRLADGLQRYAADVRAELRTDAIARAHRVATMALLPLGLCFLPAFVCIGIVPVVVGIATDAFSTVTQP